MKNSSAKLRLAVTTAALAWTMHPQSALAQNVTAADAEDVGVEEIVVTAQKRAENLQDVPVAVSAFTESRLETAGVKNVLDLNTLTPSANTSVALGFVKPFLRGIGSTGNGAGIESAVSVYVDGVYIASTPGSYFTFNDIQRIEVLKGPQGTLFGRNAVGGLMQIVTSDPGNEFHLKAEATYGNYDIWNLNAHASGPISENVGISIAAQYGEQGKGFGTNFATGTDSYQLRHDLGVRGKLVLTLGDTTIKVAGDYADRDAPLFDWRPAPELGQSSKVPSSRPWDVNNNATNISTVKGGGGSLRVEHDFGSVNLLSITAYRKTKFHYRGDVDVSPAPAITLDTNLDEKQFTQELQLQSDTGNGFEWTVGAYYFDANARGNPARTRLGSFVAPLPTSASLVETYSSLDSKAIAGFAQATVELGANTKFTGGLRYTSETRDISSAAQITFNNGNQTPLLPNPDQSTKFNKLTWRLALDHKFTDDVLGYISYNRGFKSGGFEQNFPADAAFRPEIIDAYEVGLKTQLFDNRVRLNLAGYFNEYKDRQIGLTRAGSLSIVNAGASESYGFEAELEAALGPNFTLNSSIGLMRSKFTEFLPPANPILQNCYIFTPPATTVGGRCDLKGNTTPNSPKVTFNLGGDWHHDTSFGEIGAAFNYGYNSGFFFESDNLIKQDAYHMISASIRWTSPDERFTARLWTKNMFNEAVLTQGLATAFGGLASYQAPATYGITVGVNF